MRARPLRGGAAWWLACLIPAFGAGITLAAEPAAVLGVPVSEHPPIDPPIAAAPAAPLTPEAAVSLGIRHSIPVAQARADALAAEGRLAEHRLASANPQVQAAYDLGGRRTSAQVSQPISLTGEAARARQLARAQGDVATARLTRARLSAAAEVRVAYAEAVVATRQRAVAEEAVTLADRLTLAVAAKLDVGEAAALELRLAHLSQAQAATWLLEAQTGEALALRRLSTLVQAPVRGDGLDPDPLAVAPFAPADLPVATRSDVRAAEAEVDASAAALRLARAQALPPLGVGIFLESEQGQTFAGPMLSFSLPVFQRNQGARGALAGAQAQAGVALGALRAQAQAERDTALTRAQAADGALARVEVDLIAEARLALESIALGYDAGELDLSTALLLQQQVLRGELAAITLRGQVAAARIDWALAHDSLALLGEVSDE